MRQEWNTRKNEICTHGVIVHAQTTEPRSRGTQLTRRRLWFFLYLAMRLRRRNLAGQHKRAAAPEPNVYLILAAKPAFCLCERAGFDFSYRCQCKGQQPTSKVEHQLPAAEPQQWQKCWPRAGELMATGCFRLWQHVIKCGVMDEVLCRRALRGNFGRLIFSAVPWRGSKIFAGVFPLCSSSTSQWAQEKDLKHEPMCFSNSTLNICAFVFF